MGRVIIAVLGLMLGGCSVINTYPGEHGPPKQDFSPRSIGGYKPGVGKVKAQGSTILDRMLTFPYGHATSRDYEPKA